ncbi:hypothetical protein PRIPAC_86954 [Pristionchus pacificus]|uniref:Uncharacterized protein n=1 Tax=Pristionchus pacificus TaxID=54126 RepID=A0A2A6BN11_PRIPA|nr:hypothetical protein PRIPAC_86954 [Pristionchus pacificus]|eukprot:PDM67294.1 hypothetical protein PRIPAC_48711 [Pristionchus pacificus]
MGFQVGIKYSTPDPFPQLGIKQAYVPAASSTYIAYKPYSDCLRARVRLTICGPQLDRLLDATSPHGRTIWNQVQYPCPIPTSWNQPCSDCLRARVRLTICGPQLDRLLDVTFPHGRTMPGLWLLCEGTHALYQSIIEKATVVLADLKRSHKLESSTSHKLPSSLIPTCGNCLIPS